MQIAEVADEIIKVVDVILLHYVSRDEVAHERPYLCCGVADRRTCRKDNILAAGLFQNGLCFEEYTLRFLTRRWVNSFHPALHSGGKAEVFVFVGLIDKDSVNAHAVEVLNIISGSVEQFSCLDLGVLPGDGGFLGILLFLARCRFLFARELAHFVLKA